MSGPTQPPEPECTLELRPPSPYDSKPPLLNADAGLPYEPGSMVGPYRLLQLVGEGGFGSVYMAEQQDPVIRRVALKIIKMGMDTRQVIARFEVERQALAMMDHPNIAKVLDAGPTDSGRPYFVMELVRGVPITQYCDDARLAPRERLELFVQVCRAVQHAHQKGIIHRDLKPSNVLVVLQDGVPTPKVIDFGIAKATQARLTEKTLVTEFHQLIGTPQYMAPEQADLTGLDIDTRADIYSLGVLLYELLTGTTPLDASRLASIDVAEMQRIIREEDAPTPSARLSALGGTLAKVAGRRSTDPRRLRQQLRGELDWIVMKCLEKNRARRYETAVSLAVDLERYLSHEPVLARPAGTGYRLRKFVYRHKVGVGMSAGLVATLVLGLIGTGSGMIRAQQQRSMAMNLVDELEAARSRADLEARRAQDVNTFLQNMLGSAQPGAPGGGRELKVVEILDRAAAQLGLLSGQPEVEIDARLTLGQSYRALGLYSQACEILDPARTLARRVYGPQTERTLEITAQLVFAMAQDGRAAAEPLARDTVATARRIFGERSPVTRHALNSLGVLLLVQNRHREGVEIFQTLVAQVSDQPEESIPPEWAGYFNNLAQALKAQGKPAEAERSLQQAIRIGGDHPATNPAKWARHRCSLAESLIDQLKLEEALNILTALFPEQRKLLGDSHPDVVGTETALARLLEQTGRFADALALRQGELARCRLGAPADSTAVALLRVGGLELRCGNREAAAHHLMEGIALVRTLRGESDTWWRHEWATASMELACGDEGCPPDSHVCRHGLHLLHRAVTPQLSELPSLDAIQWQDLQFKLERWSGEGLAPLALVAEGGWPELRTRVDSPSGVYLLSFRVPRKNGRPLQAAGWLLQAPWKVSLVPAGGLMQIADQAAWTLLFRTTPLEERRQSVLCLTRPSQILRGYGPGHSPWDFALIAQAELHLPTGSYLLHTEQDAGFRLSADGNIALDNWHGGGLGQARIRTSARPLFLHLESRSTSTCCLTLEPDGQLAAALLARARGETDPVPSTTTRSGP